MFGVNLSGAEFGRNRGVYGTDYIYPNAAELDYYQSHGIELIRLPFTWERMQPVLGGPLDPAELARMVAFLDAAAARGMDVIIDLHNFGRYDGQPIGSSAVPITAFQQFWTQLAGALNGHPAIAGFGIMNEPHDMGGASVWPAAAQAAVDGIRSTGSDAMIVVSGDGWSGAHSWQQINGQLHINDPLNNIIYEAHVYFDSGNQGTYDSSYDMEGAYPMIGVDRLQPFLDWLAANNARGFIGEYAVPDTDPRWLTVLDNFLFALAQNNLSSAYWGGGPWWGNYPLGIEPRGGVDRPQMDVLEKYTTAAAPGLFTPGNDTVALSSAGGTFDALGGDDVLSYTGGIVTVDGGTGSDTLDFSSFGAAVRINLRVNGTEGLTMDLPSLTGGTWRAIAELSNVENLVGTAFNDILRGNASDNTFFHIGGSDVVDGGGGTDTVDYSRYGAAVYVDLLSSAGEVRAGHRTGPLITDLVDVENVTGSAFDDDLRGDAGPNRLTGGDGNDRLKGRGGNDLLDGGSGNDTAVFANRVETYTFALVGGAVLVTGEGTDTVLDNVEQFQFLNVTLTRAEIIDGLTAPVVSTGDDTLTSSRLGGSFNLLDGNDVFTYGGGFVTVDGGPGNDTLDFSNFGAAVRINLRVDGTEGLTMDLPTLSGGIWRPIAEISNVENLVGTAFDDILRGNASDNILFYTGGSDILDGGGGNDTADYSRSGTAVWVDLTSTAAEVRRNGATGPVITDLIDVENVVGSPFADALRGDAGANRLAGGSGDDVLNGRGGNDVLWGGAGGDRFRLGMSSGSDTIGDFQPLEGDRLGLNGQSYSMRDTPDGLALDLSGGGTVLISDHTVAGFNASWIVG